MTLLSNFRSVFSEFKIYLTRAVTYVSIVNTGMIMYLFLSKVNDSGSITLGKYGMIIVFVVVMGIAITVGWLDTKFKFYHEELKRSGNRHPYFTEILNTVRNIDRRLDKIEGINGCESNETSKEDQGIDISS